MVTRQMDPKLLVPLHCFYFLWRVLEKDNQKRCKMLQRTKREKISSTSLTTDVPYLTIAMDSNPSYDALNHATSDIAVEQISVTQLSPGY